MIDRLATFAIAFASILFFPASPRVLKLRWDKSISQSPQVEVAGYRLHAYVGGAEVWVKDLPSKALAAHVSHLTAGEDYEFRVGVLWRMDGASGETELSNAVQYHARRGLFLD